jgi:uncharacterized protein YkwD
MFALVFAIIFATSPAGVPTSAVTSGRVAAPPDTLPFLERHVVRLTNRERRAAGLAALRRDRALDRAACRHSRDMLERGFLDHVTPDGQSFNARMAEDVRGVLIDETGENLAGRIGAWPNPNGTEDQEAVAATMMEGWMDSPGHRKNVLHDRFTHIGVCALYADGEMRVTQIFGRIRGRLDRPLPTRAAPGERLPLRITPVPDSAGEAVRYDYVAPSDTLPVPAPAFNDTLQLPDRPGRYRPRFYFRILQGYRLVLGPALTVRPPGEPDER